MKHITVVGSGTMGNGIAHVFAQSGHKVVLTDISQDSLGEAVKTITKNLSRQVAKQRISESDKEAALAHIFTTASLPEAVKEADLVIEAATENPDVKAKIFEDLDYLCKPATILATNTSSISITQIAATTRRPEKVIGMHFMNPVPVMKLVEIICGYDTDPAVTQAIVAKAKALGKVPVEVNDYPGFVSNRILMPLINEAIITLFEGVAGVEAIDTVMKLGMAHPMGPLQLADFIGLDVCLSIMRVLHEGLGLPKYAPCPLLVKMVNAGHLGIKSGSGFYDWSKGTKELIVSRQFKK